MSSLLTKFYNKNIDKINQLMNNENIYKTNLETLIEQTNKLFERK